MATPPHKHRLVLRGRRDGSLPGPVRVGMR